MSGIRAWHVMVWIAVGLVLGSCGVIDQSTDALIVDRGDENLAIHQPALFWGGVLMVTTGVLWFLLQWYRLSKDTSTAERHGRFNG